MHQSEKIRFSTENFEVMISQLPDWVIRRVLELEKNGGHFSYIINGSALEVWGEYGKIKEYNKPREVM
jgi:hypothetical protein